MIADISHLRATPDENTRLTRSLEWSEYCGWQALVMTQGQLELTVVPSIGGRLMSIRHAGVELAFVNDRWAGQTPDGNATQWQALCGEWGFPLWGGGKTWVAPEAGWPDGAPQRDLDSGPYEALRTWCGTQSMGVELQSGVCRQSGLRVFRRLELSAASGVWTTLHRLVNCSDHAIECGIWDVLMLRRPGIVTLRLDARGDQWREHVVPFPDKGPLGDVRESRFVELANGGLSTACDEAVEFKLGVILNEGVIDVDFDFPEGRRHLNRRFEVVSGGHYFHGAPVEIFNAPQLPYFEIESHGVACMLEPGAACDLLVEECAW
jgi:hypothetical protein